MVDKVLFSHNVTEWGTPLELYNRLNQVFHFDLDPCAPEDNPLNVPCIITKEKNGLKVKWFGKVFVNPPYDDIPSWLAKAQKELLRPSGVVSKVVFLLPARTDTKWFHNYIYTNTKLKVTVHFLKGRLKFRGAKNSAPFPSMIVILTSSSSSSSSK